MTHRVRSHTDGEPGRVYRLKMRTASRDAARYRLLARVARWTGIVLWIASMIVGVFWGNALNDDTLPTIIMCFTLVSAVACIVLAELVLDTRARALEYDDKMYGLLGSKLLHTVLPDRMFRWLPWPFIRVPVRARCASCAWRGFWRLRREIACWDGDRHLEIIRED